MMIRQHHEKKSPGRDHRLPVMGLVGRRIDPANISSRATTCRWIHDFHLLSSLSPFISWPLPSSWFFSPEFMIILFRILGPVWRSRPRPHCWIRLRDLWELRLRHWTVRPWCDGDFYFSFEVDTRPRHLPVLQRGLQGEASWSPNYMISCFWYLDFRFDIWIKFFWCLDFRFWYFNFRF